MVIAVVNTKGGVAKTTTAVHLAVLLGAVDPVLLIDADSQGGASLALGVRRQDLNPSLAHPLLYGLPVSRAVRRHIRNGTDLITGSADLANSDVALADVADRAHCLGKLVDRLRRQYRTIIIDCPPGLSLLQLNVLVAADSFVVPVSPHYLALEGVASSLHTISRVRVRFRPRLRPLGIAVTMRDIKAQSAAEIVRLLRGHYGEAVFRTEIPLDGGFAEASSFGKTIFEYEPASRAADAYRRLAAELLQRISRRTARRN